MAGFGFWSFLQLRIEAYPDISDTQVVVVTQSSGHAAEEMEQQVTIPIERVLNNVPGIIARRSRTIFGLSVVELTFEYGTNDYFARQVVRRKTARRRIAARHRAHARPAHHAHRRALPLPDCRPRS